MIPLDLVPAKELRPVLPSSHSHDANARAEYSSAATPALRRDRPCVGDFVRVGLPDLVCPKRGNGDRLAIQCHELDFVSSSFAMNEHDGADVSVRKFLLRQITREHDSVKFTNHFDD